MEDKPKNPSLAASYGLAIRIVVDFTAIIALPALAGAYAGKWLDQRWGTTPLMFVLLLIVAFSFTAVMIFRKAKYYAQIYERTTK